MAFDKTRARWAAALFVTAPLAWIVSCGGGGGSVPTSPGSPSPSTTPSPATAVTPPPTTTTTTMPSPAPEPAPQPTPETCPTLNEWTSRLYKSYDTFGNLVPNPVVGGKAIIDSTPRFDGQACNLEHDNCGGRECEDPRGGDWTLLEGDSPSRSTGFQFHIGPLKEGTHRWRVCPLPDVRDAQDDPVRVGPDPCSEGSFIVS